MDRLLSAKANFIHNIFNSTDFALSQIGDTQYLGMNVRSIIAPNSKHEILIYWDAEAQSLGIKEACKDGKSVDLDFDALSEGQLDDFLYSLMMLFNFVVQRSTEDACCCDGHCCQNRD